ncbi:amphi-Trp domain-containing protein [Desulfocurvus vexinensis]|uniref:amphi-Trp domain-containing protein n=1 Tax=Desulfocurvus vexinensis TaxID=399548 RepID=UPI0004AD1A33|nr:amphi-Trp domain-containing protein [Desulfocurvus vexinensis]
MEKDKISLEQTMALEDAIAYLEDLADGFRAGKVIVAQGDTSLELVPADSVEVEVEARVKKGKAKFSLELEWRTPMEPGEQVVITPVETDLPASEAPKAEAKPAEAKAPEAPKAPAKDAAAPKDAPKDAKPAPAKPGK